MEETRVINEDNRALQTNGEPIKSSMSQTVQVTYHKCGVCVPQSLKETQMLDKLAGNTKWDSAMLMEIEKLHEYNFF